MVAMKVHSLQKVVDVVTDYLATLINDCLKCCVFPEEQNGPKLYRSKIRRVTLTSRLATGWSLSFLFLARSLKQRWKLSWSTFLTEIMDWVSMVWGDITPQQWTALISVTSKILVGFENKFSIVLTMCDLSKAFDVVPDNILLQKPPMSRNWLWKFCLVSWG